MAEGFAFYILWKSFIFFQLGFFFFPAGTGSSFYFRVCIDTGNIFTLVRTRILFFFKRRESLARVVGSLKSI